MQKILIAFGGNALLRNGDDSTFEAQLIRAREAFAKISDTILENDVIITHGNGPQVGNILLQNELSGGVASPMPLHACGSMSQGLIGEILLNAYDDIRIKRGISKEGVVLMTRTVVSPDDPAFRNPSKPIGPYYDRQVSERLSREKDWVMREENGKGLRRLVPSPVPVDIVERSAIFSMLNDGFMPICVGGGGIPVVKTPGGFVGVDAVIDKDLASSLIATILEVDRFVILTDVSNIFRDFGKKTEEGLHRISHEKLGELLANGSFPSGSMEPKVMAVLDFVRKTGKKAVIGSLDDAGRVIAEEAGTVVY